MVVIVALSVLSCVPLRECVVFHGMWVFVFVSMYAYARDALVYVMLLMLTTPPRVCVWCSMECACLHLCLRARMCVMLLCA